MARYGLKRVTKEVELAYKSFLNMVHLKGHKNYDVLPMNMSSYDDGSLALTVTVHQCLNLEDAEARVIEELEKRGVPFTSIEKGPIDFDMTYIFVHHHN